MTFSNLSFVLRRLTRRSEPRWKHRLLSTRQFQRLLARERARSDRSGDRFSLLVFAPQHEADGPHLQLVKALRRRLRSTDEAGWFDQRRVGVVLPGTPPRGAWKLVDDIARHWTEGVPPLCQVFSYPSDPSQLDESVSHRRDPVPAEQAANFSKADPPADALEPLFMKAMPLWKRTIDVVGALVGLLLLSPVLLVVALAVKLTSPGPVFFRQLRSGCGGQPFLMYKFRSMVTEAESLKSQLMELNEQDGPAFKIAADPRITRLGKFLRDTSLDELPQLWNVVKGEMSLVGPRPLPCSESDACLSWQRRRLDVTPGLTCIWQVKGRSQVTFNEWVRMDLEYVGRRSLWQDVKILAVTVPAVLQRRGAK